MLANPANMAPHTRFSQFPERTVRALDGIVSDPSPLLAASHVKTVGPTQELDILSASHYPHALISGYESSENARPKRKASAKSSTKQFYGGVVFRASPSSNSQDDDSVAVELEAQPLRPNKRSRKSKNDDDNANDDPNKKQRGRPRLDTQDETAADRRRTQIRLAQRAYRHRKETTIVALKRRVIDLHSAIEKMNNTFMDLHDNIVGAGLTQGHSLVAQQLQAASDEFSEMAKMSEDFSDDEEMKKLTEIPPVKKARQNSLPSDDLKESNHQRKARSNNVTPQPAMSDDADVEELPPSHPYEYMNTAGWAGLQQDLLQFNAHVPDIPLSFEQLYSKQMGSLENPLSSPDNMGFYTYSFQETTFARRLQRMTLERGYRSLSNPEIDPAFIKRAFRFTFCFSNPKRMLNRFQIMLKRKAGDSLENWNIPFFHIGGAGTHFPRRDSEGRPIYPPNMLPPEKAFGEELGPRPWVEVETPREGTTQEILDSIGFGGMWFDSHDVEEYLKTKGVYLDGHSSFVEVDPSAIQLTIPTMSKSSSTSEISSPTSGQSPLRTPSPIFGNGGLQSAQDQFIQPAFDDFNVFDMPSLNTDSLEGLDQAAMDTYNKQIWPWSDQPVPSPNLSQSEDTGQMQNMLANYALSASKSSQPLTFDVQKFLERMIEGSACLGRAPGFRKEMVDNALALSLAEAY